MTKLAILSLTTSGTGGIIVRHIEQAAAIGMNGYGQPTSHTFNTVGKGDRLRMQDGTGAGTGPWSLSGSVDSGRSVTLLDVDGNAVGGPQTGSFSFTGADIGYDLVVS